MIGDGPEAQVQASDESPKVDIKSDTCSKEAVGKGKRKAVQETVEMNRSTETQSEQIAADPKRDAAILVDCTSDEQQLLSRRKEGGEESVSRQEEEGARGGFGRGGGRGGKSKRGRRGEREPNWRQQWQQQPGHFQPYERKRARGGRSSSFQGQSGFERRNVRDQETRAEELQAAALSQKDAMMITFDCRLRPKAELTGWIRFYQPSLLKRSQNIGYVVLLSKNCTSRLQERFICNSEEFASSHADLVKDWEQLTTDPTTTVDYTTIKALAKKHDVKGGKWLFTVGRQHLDALWMYLCSAIASEEAPMPCLAAKVNSVNDVEPIGQRQERSEAMISVYTRDFTDEDNVFEVERALRKVPVKLQMTYKPDLYTSLGIYRNNKFRLRPTIYSSKWHVGSGESVIESVFNFDWSYKGGTGDLREVLDKKRADAKPRDEKNGLARSDREEPKADVERLCKEELEQLVDKIIDINLDEAELMNKMALEGAKPPEKECGTGKDELELAVDMAVDQLIGQVKKTAVEPKRAGHQAKEMPLHDMTEFVTEQTLATAIVEECPEDTNQRVTEGPEADAAGMERNEPTEDTDECEPKEVHRRQEIDADAAAAAAAKNQKGVAQYMPGNQACLFQQSRDQIQAELESGAGGREVTQTMYAKGRQLSVVLEEDEDSVETDTGAPSQEGADEGTENEEDSDCSDTDAQNQVAGAVVKVDRNGNIALE